MPTQVIFTAIVLAVAGLLVRAVRATDRSESRSTGVIAAVFIGWLVVPAVLAWQGVLDRFEPPPPGLLLVGVITLGTIGLALSGVGSRLVAGLPLAAIVGYQAFRVPLEWVLHRLYLEGTIPIQMTYAGRNFDVVTGITAALLAVWLSTGRRHRGLVLAWNLLGLALLINIVVIAVLSMPLPIRHFMNEPANRLPVTFPFVWLPTFLVQAALFGHLMVFRALRQQRH